ncbi:hypothetical protein [Denitratisoma sp. DHT3]|uniref:hypothetical protein n=1 Tax=Denitratisoma sp. DHT3 TaxID=1981880 RepID=UPI0016475441|nr:hypothetical protein [Denitratisoma sp. DHT3]
MKTATSDRIKQAFRNGEVIDKAVGQAALAAKKLSRGTIAIKKSAAPLKDAWSKGK